MNFPRRLLESTEDDLARRVLRSAQHDRPSCSAAARTGRLLGLSASLLGTLTGGVAGAAVGTGAAGAAAGTAAAGTAATAGAYAGGLILAKYVGIGVVAGMLATGGVVAVRSAYRAGQPDRRAPRAASSAFASEHRASSATHAAAASPAPEPTETTSALLEVRRPDRAERIPSPRLPHSNRWKTRSRSDRRHKGLRGRRSAEKWRCSTVHGTPCVRETPQRLCASSTCMPGKHPKGHS
jgi:hypothetical protein